MRKNYHSRTDKKVKLRKNVAYLKNLIRKYMTGTVQGQAIELLKNIQEGTANLTYKNFTVPTLEPTPQPKEQETEFDKRTDWKKANKPVQSTPVSKPVWKKNQESLLRPIGKAPAGEKIEELPLYDETGTHPIMVKAHKVSVNEYNILVRAINKINGVGE